jgi:hypothetical protein
LFTFASKTLLMYFELLYSVLPQVAAKQTRVLTFLEDESASPIPPGEYAFLPFYCNERKCDCRRVMIKVVDEHINIERPQATLSYGWEPASFYKKWSVRMPPEELAWFKGPALDPFQSQGPYADSFERLFISMLEDQEYSRRFARLYAQFKWKIGMKIPKDLQPWVGLTKECLCGSGELFKFCCGQGARRTLRSRR